MGKRKDLSDKENEMMAEMADEGKPNAISGAAILFYKLYLKLLSQVVRLDAEIEELKKGGK